MIAVKYEYFMYKYSQYARLQVECNDNVFLGWQGVSNIIEKNYAKFYT